MQFLAAVDFSLPIWENRNRSAWKEEPGYWIVYKKNSVRSMPSLGTNGGPLGITLSGPRWTRVLLADGQDFIMFDDFHTDPGSRTPYLKKQMKLCHENAWKGVEIYLKATCSLIPALPPPAQLRATAMDSHISNLPVGGGGSPERFIRRYSHK